MTLVENFLMKKLNSELLIVHIVSVIAVPSYTSTIFLWMIHGAQDSAGCVYEWCSCAGISTG